MDERIQEHGRSRTGRAMTILTDSQPTSPMLPRAQRALPMQRALEVFGVDEPGPVRSVVRWHGIPSDGPYGSVRVSVTVLKNCLRNARHHGTAEAVASSARYLGAAPLRTGAAKDVPCRREDGANAVGRSRAPSLLRVR